MSNPITKNDSTRAAPIVGVLMSGGLDSSILVANLLSKGQQVQPFYIRGGLFWEKQEEQAVRSFLEAVQTPTLRKLVALEMPVADLYLDHWSVTGKNVPAADSPDEAVFLPGRNALLVIKAAIWCQLHGVDQLALAPLANNPFADSSDSFFAHFQGALSFTGQPIEILRPFHQSSKTEVMHRGRGLPLELTFSCISPVGDLHCGKCNKCEERKMAFSRAHMPDPTRYANAAIQKIST